MTALRSRRTVAALGAVSAGVLLLSACDKPTPMATVTVGTNTVSTQTDCYHDGKAVSAAEATKCLTAKDVQSITVDPDDTVRFGVDPSIADKGWTILLNGQPLTDSSTKTYRTIPGSVFFNAQYGASGSSTRVSVKQGENTLTGLWTFKFKKNS
ncbi:DUF2771 domain-containing protein [Streptomyces sp. NPDC052051]|uniref:DUF2771 domain-containing protein n=1 Tax=Streptomyces sp. NPDC052051 TaxID=3154649 RepID=UPI003436902E